MRLAEIPAAYRAWCHERGLAPLSEKEFGEALSALFTSVGLYRHGHGRDAAIAGIEWREAAQPAAPLRLTAGEPARRLGPMTKRGSHGSGRRGLIDAAP